MKSGYALAAVLFAFASGATHAADSDKSMPATSVTITGAKIVMSRQVLSDVLISFDVKNGSNFAFRGIFLHGVLQTPGRAVPWIEADLGYKIPGGLEPGEQVHLDLTPGMGSDWNHVEAAWLKSGVLTLTPSAVEDSAGATITVQK